MIPITTHVREYADLKPEDNILYDAQPDDYHHFTVADAALLDLPNVTDAGKDVAQRYLGVGVSDAD